MGLPVGLFVSSVIGCSVGSLVSSGVGSLEGSGVGSLVGSDVSSFVDDALGSSVGRLDGDPVGLRPKAKCVHLNQLNGDFVGVVEDEGLMGGSSLALAKVVRRNQFTTSINVVGVNDEAGFLPVGARRCALLFLPVAWLLHPCAICVVIIQDEWQLFLGRSRVVSGRAPLPWSSSRSRGGVFPVLVLPVAARVHEA